MKNINDENFNDEIQEGISVVDFYTDTCGPCKVQEKFLQKIEEENPDIKVLKANLEENLGNVQFYSIASVPTLLFFKGIDLIKSKRGLQDDKIISKILEEIRNG